MRGRQHGDEKQIPKMPNNSVAIGVPVSWEKIRCGNKEKKHGEKRKAATGKSTVRQGLLVKAYSVPWSSPYRNQSQSRVDST